jgi:hypothetical protein
MGDGNRTVALPRRGVNLGWCEATSRSGDRKPYLESVEARIMVQNTLYLVLGA